MVSFNKLLKLKGLNLKIRRTLIIELNNFKDLKDVVVTFNFRI